MSRYNVCLFACRISLRPRPPPPGEGGGVKSRMCLPYPQRVVILRRLNGALSRNNRINRLVPCRCLDEHVKEPYEMYMAFGRNELNWLLNVAIKDISVIYVTAHRCAGGLKTSWTSLVILGTIYLNATVSICMYTYTPVRTPGV